MRIHCNPCCSNCRCSKAGYWAKWRTNKDDDPMQVISGAMGKEKVHFEAPASVRLEKEMDMFIDWFNSKKMDPLMKAAIAHLWFVTIHPFEDGNGRMARAIADMQLARADETSYRFYSMSSQIRKERNDYYFILEQTQKGSLDITIWIQWFLGCLERAYGSTQAITKYAKITKCSRDTALRDLTNLIEKGVLIKEEGLGKNTSYVLIF